MRARVQWLAAVALIAGCGGEQIPTDASARLQSQSPALSFGADVNKDLATLRQVTAPFQQFERARDAGWSTPITGCMVDPAGAGGMGFHYGQVGLIDGSVSVDEPELLLYEPEKNGRLRLVAVEYIIPYTFHARSAAPPKLFGQEFKQVDAFQLWGLHAWVWRENPSGMFADWNPKVTCENAAARVVMSHG